MPATEIYVTSYFIPLSAVARWPRAMGDAAITRHWYVGWIIFLMILSSVSVAVRFYAQFTKRIRKAGVDDIFIVFAWLFAICFTISTSWSVLYAGFDRHIWENLEVGEKSGFAAFITEIFFLSSTCLSKLSILTFQRRLLQRTHNPRYTRAIDGAIIFTVLFWLSFSLALGLSCHPREALWKSMNIGYTVKYRCYRKTVPDRLVGVFSVLSDIYALIIPELLIWKLRLDKKAKIILYLVFGSGLLVVGAGIGRTVWLDRLWSDRLRDLTWVGYDAMVWSGTELQLSIVCASAPALKAFISNVKAGITRATTSRNSSKEGSKDSFRIYERWPSVLVSFEKEMHHGKGILVTETVAISSAPVGPPPRRESVQANMPPLTTKDVEQMTFPQVGVIGELAPWPSDDNAERPAVERSMGSISSTISAAPSYSSTVPLHQPQQQQLQPSLTVHRTVSEFELYHSQFKDTPSTATTANKVSPRSSFSTSEESLPICDKDRMSLAEFLRSG